jgi:hypothetical protein
VREALRAAAARPVRPFVREAFFAAAFNDPLPRRRAVARANRDNEDFDAARRPSRRSAALVAAERLAEGFRRDRDRLKADWALRRVRSEVFPFSGACNFTPARRAFDRPMAMACFDDRAPCFPLRMWSISSRTNSPACVDADLPLRLSLLALSSVCFSGTFYLPSEQHVPANTFANAPEMPSTLRK